MTTVTDADREAYLAFNMLPPDDAAAVRAGEWDAVTGLQVLARHREQSILEGMEIMREAAVQWAKDDAKLCDCAARSEGECACGAWCDWKTVPMERVAQNLAELAPAAILAQHKRAKVMDSAADADLI